MRYSVAGAIKDKARGPHGLGASACCRGAPFTALPLAPIGRGDLVLFHGPLWVDAFLLAAPLPVEAAMLSTRRVPFVAPQAGQPAKQQTGLSA